MSMFEAQGDSTVVCVICFSAKTACKTRSKHCCSRQRSYQSPYFGNNMAESHIIVELRSLSESQQRGLAFRNGWHYILQCQPISEVRVGHSYDFMLDQGFDVANHDLVIQFDRMVLETWAPHIQTGNNAMESVPLACLGIGYFSMLIFATLHDDSNSPLINHDLSPVFAEFAVMRIHELIVDTVNLIRDVQYKLNVESRSWVILWFLYLKTALAKMQKLGGSGLLDNAELFRHIQKVFQSLRKELRACSVADCQNNIDWTAPFKDSQRGLVEKLSTVHSWTLSVKAVSSPAQYEPQDEHQSNIQLLDTAANSHPSISLSYEPMIDSYPIWLGSNVTAETSEISSFVEDDELAPFLSHANDPEYLSFNENIGIDGGTFSYQDYLQAPNPSQNNLETYHTLS